MTAPIKSGQRLADNDAAVLIIAGGRGTRFWPLSRGNRPKPLFSLDGKTSLLSETVARARTLTDRERVFVLIASGQERAFRAALRGLVPARNILVEPQARGTTVAIAYGAALIKRRLGEATIAVTPADHLISPVAAFERTLTGAIALASSRRAGNSRRRAEPRRARLRAHQDRPQGRRRFRGGALRRKAAPRVAAKMVRSRQFLWNAGMFVIGTRTLDGELRAHCPALAAAIEKIAAAPAQCAALYRRLDFDAFDREIVEKSRRVLAVRARFRWHDVGSWEGLWEAMRGKARAHDHDQNVLSQNVLTGNAIALEAKGVFAHAHGRLMVLMGVDDLVVVDSGDAILIARRSRSQELRLVTDAAQAPRAGTVSLRKPGDPHPRVPAFARKEQTPRRLPSPWSGRGISSRARGPTLLPDQGEVARTSRVRVRVA